MDISVDKHAPYEYEQKDVILLATCHITTKIAHSNKNCETGTK